MVVVVVVLTFLQESWVPISVIVTPPIGLSLFSKIPLLLISTYTYPEIIAIDIEEIEDELELMLELEEDELAKVDELAISKLLELDTDELDFVELRVEELETIGLSQNAMESFLGLTFL